MTFTTTWRRMLLVAATFLAVSCGGGGDASAPAASPPPPSAPPPSAPPSLALGPQYAGAALRLYESISVHAYFATSPFMYLDSRRVVSWTTGRCAYGGSGSVQALLDGSPPTAGTVLPTGRHTYTVTFNNCLVDGLVGIDANGAASAVYTSTSLNDLSAEVSVNLMQGKGSLGFYSDISDVTVDGSATWDWVQTSTSNTRTYTPMMGARLINNLTTNVATFGGGTYSVRAVYGVDPPIAVLNEFNALLVAINGTPYILNGSLQLNYGFNGQAGGSGEVRIMTGETLVARIYADAGGRPRAEIFSPLVTF